VPRTTVPVQVPLNIIGRFNAAPATRDNFVENRALQAVCLKWICMAYDLIEDKAQLHALYVLPIGGPAPLVGLFGRFRPTVAPAIRTIAVPLVVPWASDY